jgi:hypothetical protein
MNDPPSDHDPGHEPQGVVETIREEIEEVVEDVVEHVPQPVRWTVGKLARLASLAFLGVAVLAIISAVLFFMNRTELVARELSILLNRTLREHSDLVLDLRDIRGNPFTGFRAVEPRVRFRDGATLLAAREMKVDYSAWGLVFGRSGQIELTLRTAAGGCRCGARTRAARDTAARESCRSSCACATPPCSRPRRTDARPACR